MVALIIHTGVGSKAPKNDTQKICENKINEAAESGIEMLKEGKSAFDVVERIINILEASGLFNAGIGSVTQSDGYQRMDAAIMGSDLRCGAVALVTNTRYPISIAKKIMETTKHIYLFGDFAREFGKKYNIPEFSDNSLDPIDQSKSDLFIDGTVGAVVLDNNEILATGTSTGGLIGALAGRVGDSPIIGGGIYANEFGGISCTGIGENIIRTTLARYASFQLENGYDVKEAANLAINYFKKKTNSVAGLIILTNKGEYGISHNGKYMNWKYLID